MKMRKLLVITEESASMLHSIDSMQAFRLFRGSFKEMRNFYQILREQFTTDLYIISSKYGLINGEEEIQPYSIKHKKDLITFSIEKNIIEEFIQIIKSYDLILISLSRPYLKLIFSPGNGINFIEKLSAVQRVIIIVSTSYFNCFNSYSRNLGLKITLFPRVGISRIGKNNMVQIINLIERLIHFNDLTDESRGSEVNSY